MGGSSSPPDQWADAGKTFPRKRVAVRLALALLASASGIS